MFSDICIQQVIIRNILWSFNVTKRFSKDFYITFIHKFQNTNQLPLGHSLVFNIVVMSHVIFKIHDLYWKRVDPSAFLDWLNVTGPVFYLDYFHPSHFLSHLFFIPHFISEFLLDKLIFMKQQFMTVADLKRREHQAEVLFYILSM